MKKLGIYVQDINEQLVYEAGRGRPRKVKVDGVGAIDVYDADDIKKNMSPEEKKSLAAKAKNAESKKGKDEDKNGTHGNWAVEPPYDDGAVTPLSKEEMNKNMLRLKRKFDAEEPFFIMGEAGWGKTSIIKDMAKRDGRYIITVYLDKAVATDLGGIPVPIPIKNGDEDNAKIVNAMPDWAAYMLEHPKDQFLLFFDEMNQAAPDVMNALMPIVLENVICNIEFKNFMVGAAGNFEHENRSGVNELSGPLESRFKPIIIWESGDESSWQQAFKYMEKEWGEKVNVKILKMLAENAQCFNNPREVEHKILKWAYKISNKIKDGKTFEMDSDETLDQITRLIHSDKNLNRTQQDALSVISEEITKWINNPDNYGKEETGRKRGKGRDMIPDELKESIIKGMKRGYVEGIDSSTGDKAKFGISRENISSVFCTDEFIDPEDEESYEEPINAEMLERLIAKLEADGIKFKYETNDEFIKKGLKNPAED